MASGNKRADILEAAAGIVETSGAAHLTIDAVAAAASVSKGGVLYHFPSKQALLEGMLTHLLDEITVRTETYVAAHGEAENGALVARIVEEHDQSPEQRVMSRAFLAAAAENPELMAPARQEARRAFREAAAGSASAEMGWIVLLAVEGLRFLEMLNLLPLSRSERSRIHRQLVELAKAHAA